MPHSRTIALIRQLTATRTKRKPRKMPPPYSLDPLQREFAKAIAKVGAQARDAFRSVEPEILEDLAEQRAAAQKTIGLDSAAARTDQQEKMPPLDSRQARRLIAKAQARFQEGLSNKAITDVTASFGERTSDLQQRSLDRQLRAAVGVPYSALEPAVHSQVPVWTRQSVALIKTVPERYFESLESDVIDAYANGMHPSTLAEHFAQRYEVSQTNGERIARTSISQLSAEMNKQRQEALGVTGATWRTAADSRVRDNHQMLEGVAFTWDEEVEGGGTSDDESGFPGSGINCRCYAEPDLSELLG